MFKVGQYFPHEEHVSRIKRYQENKELFKGNHYEILDKETDVLSSYQERLIYIAVNLAGLICKKSADFLFGENAIYSAGKGDDSNEQKKIESWVRDNDLNITNYESSLSNAYRGDSFYKIRWGQEHEGLVHPLIDPFRVVIEAQNAEFVFPETYPNDVTKVMAYHIGIPVEVADSEGDEYILQVESHYPNRIVYRQFRMNPTSLNGKGLPNQWRIYAEIEGGHEVVTNVPFPLVVHVPNYSTDDSWEGIDDLTELRPLMSELNTRLSQISEILSKHADPLLVVPQGTLVEDENGNPAYRVGVDKVFETMVGEQQPQYITWNGQLEYAFREVERIIELILIQSEIPSIVVGLGDGGTSGSSGLAIKWRMNSLLAKINRKRQYYDKGLKRVFTIAQLLEQDRLGRLDYEMFAPHIKFKDGLPEDEMEKAQIMQIRTGSKATISQKRAIMELEGISEEQAELILAEIEDETPEVVDPASAFQVNDDSDDDLDPEDDAMIDEEDEE